MKNRRLVILLCIFTMAMIALVAVQVVVSRKSAKISDDLFNISMSNAMDNVLQQFDRMKLEDFVDAKSRATVAQNRRIDEINDKMVNLIASHDDLFYDIQRIRFGVALRDSAMVRRHAMLSEKEKGYLTQYNTLLSARNRLIEECKRENSRRKTSTYDKGYQLTSDNFNYELLESIICEELTINGINAMPQIGVYNVTTGEYLHTSENADKTKLSATQYRYDFSISHVPTAAEYCILLSFPSEYMFLKSADRILTYIICLLLLIIFTLFYIAIHITFNMRKLDEMKTTFINNMTHEIKTPISTIGLACEMLNDPSMECDNDMRRTFVNTIADENRRMRILVDTLLQNSKMSNKNFKLNISEAFLNEIAADATRSFQLTIQTREGTLEEEYDESLPMIAVDKLHISNMIHNLIDNAIKYSENKPYIKISTHNNGKSVSLSVEDHGIGIEPEDQKHIFEKFYRVSTGNVHNVKGFGIGLNYVANVVALHGGNITVESEPGKGSRFNITLPL